MRFTTFLYGLAWIAQIIFSFFAFPTWKNHVSIPSIALVGIAGWIYGKSTGYLMIIVSMINHYMLCNVLFPEFNIYPADKAPAAFMMITIAWLTSSLKESHDSLKYITTSLEAQVEDRTTELNTRTAQLISHDEDARIELGQDIHDGLGQYLTGLLLYSSSLEAELCGKNSPEAARSTALVESAQKTLHMARKASRTLFPVRMPETGIEAAIFELTSYFSETNAIQFNTRIDRREQYLTSEEKIHLYRIAYEGILNALHHTNPTHILITLSFENSNFRLIIESNGRRAGMAARDSMEVQLMHYRARQINGRLEVKHAKEDTIRIECIMPCNHTALR